MAMITRYEIDASTGKIRAVTSDGVVYVCNPQLSGVTESQFRQMLVNHAAGSGTYFYCEFGDIVERQSAPSQFHEWDEQSMTWAYDLVAEKAKAHVRIKEARDSAEFGTFAWNGHVFDADERSRGRLNLAFEGAKEAIALDNTAWRGYWKLANNLPLELTAPDLVEVVRAMGEAMKAAHATAGVLAYFIDTATTPEELAAVVWPSN